jgi:hypothetical protein
LANLSSASSQSGQQDYQRRDPQSHPDQEVFAASYLSSIHGEPLSRSVPGNKYSNGRATRLRLFFSVAYTDIQNMFLCQKISACVFPRTHGDSGLS